jgi:hypothetical protein
MHESVTDDEEEMTHRLSWLLVGHALEALRGAGTREFRKVSSVHF